MIKKTIKFTDFNDNPQEKDFFFHLSKGELVKMQMAAVTERTDGLQEKINRIVDTRNGKEIVQLVEEIVEMSYGIKSGDGSRFIKNDEIFADFKSTDAYSELIFELATDADFLAQFIKGLMPANLNAEVDKEVSASLEARRRSEAQMQGHQKPAPKVETVQAPPVLEASAPVFGGSDDLPLPAPTPAPLKPSEMANMTPEEIQAAFASGRPYSAEG